MDAVISAYNDAGVLEQCQRLLSQLAEVDLSPQTPIGLDSSTSKGVGPVPRDRKRAFVHRLVACDGPLACHAIQGCLHQYVCVCATTISRGGVSHRGELEEWFAVVLDAIIDCLGEKVVGERTAIRRLRLPIFLLQLLSTVLKSERGASHPERSPRVANTPGGSSKETFAADDEVCCEWEREAAQTCAKVANTYIDRMIRATAALMLGQQNVAPINGHVSGRLDVADVGFWVLALSSDILKHLRKNNWSYGDCTSPVRCKRQRDDETRGSDVEVAGILNDDGSSSSGRGVSKGLDFPGFAEAVAAFPVGCGTGTMDVALKWLEVTQLLMGAAETRWQSVLVGIFRSVPPTLWRLASHAGSLLLQAERPRSPGSAFVEKGGADGALAQAMLTLVFRIVRYGGKQGHAVEPGIVVNSLGESSPGYTVKQERRVGGEEGKPPTTRPWSTAVEALVATATTNTDDAAESYLGFAGLLVRLFSDQDDALVDMLLSNLYIFHKTRPARGEPEAICGSSSSAPPVLQHLYHVVLHPGVLFAALLSEVRFDSGVLLDWLISPETNFLQYLTMLLRLALAEWSDFATRVSCARIVAIEDSEDACVVAAGEIDEEEGKEEEELILSEEEAGRLGQAVSCLSTLVASARGLEKNGLSPYNLAPLLRRIDQVVSLYEDCGDAEEEGSD